MKIVCDSFLTVATLLLSTAAAVVAFAPPPQPTTGCCSRQSTTHLALSDSPSTASSQQKEYGKTLEFPDTYVRCGKCQAIYAIKADDLGTRGKGCRLECSVCGHSWFQSRDRIMNVRDGFEMVDMPESDLKRIALNIEEGKSPGFMGAAKLYVGNIAFECSEQDLMDVFSEVGVVGDVSLVRDDEGKNRGFGFITMRTQEAGDKALETLDGREVFGRTIAVRESNN